jgi:hypothetical protein
VKMLVEDFKSFEFLNSVIMNQEHSILGLKINSRYKTDEVSFREF